MDVTAPPTPPTTQGAVLADGTPYGSVMRHKRFYVEDAKLKDPVIIRVCFYCVSTMCETKIL